jgi:L-alanine-DL-glutamate epimerase-like enolase superfamily enzyme
MGGITELTKVFAMANANNITVKSHCFYDGRACLPRCMRAGPSAGPMRRSSGVRSHTKA